MDEQTAQTAQSAQMSGEGTITGPGIKSRNKISLIVGCIIILMLIAGGAILYRVLTGTRTTAGINCVAKPACLDANPPCAITEPAGGWCPK
jgi:hypothetical protein